MKSCVRILSLAALLLSTFGITTAQAPPVDLQGFFSSMDHAVKLRWHAPYSSDSPVHYNVYKRAPSDSDFTLIAMPHEREYNDTAVAPSSGYAYTATAVYAGDIESPRSNVILVSTGGGIGGPFLSPRDLTGHFNGPARRIELAWLAPDTSASPSAYKIFRKESPGGMFMPIGVSDDLSFNDYMIHVGRLYSYNVVALYRYMGTSPPSNTVDVLAASDSSGDSGFVAIRFTSEPIRSGVVGQPYTYDAEVSTIPPDAEVCFSLRRSPPGMTIDASTGIIQWTPTTMGIYGVEIKARPCSGAMGGAHQEFCIVVLSGNPGSIAGNVQNAEGDGIAQVKMKLFNVSHGFFTTRMYTDSAGNYSFPTVNPGTYLLRADADDDVYQDEWFDNAKRRRDATRIVIAEGLSFTANFVLDHKDTTHQQYYTLSGTVRDTLGSPIQNALVTAFRDCTHDSLYDHYNDHHRYHEMLRVVRTDPNGNYSLNLRGGTYIVGTKAQGFLPQFYDHKPSPAEADRIELTANVSGIDFDLVLRDTARGSISGVIRSAEDSSGLRSFVLGFQRHTPTLSSRGYVVSTYSDSSGAYTLEPLRSGDYIVLAIPWKHFIPTFYNLAGGTPFLSEATPVTVSGNVVTGINIYAIPDTDDGLNMITGRVGGIDGIVSTSSPLGGVVVTVTDDSNLPVSSGVTDDVGAYEATGLAEGFYTLIFQKPGYLTTSVPIEVQYVNDAPTITRADAALLAEGGPGIPGLMAVDRNWNLVSLPVDVADPHQSVVFPSAISEAFSFAASGGYQTESVLSAGTGYWLKFANASAFAIEGTERTSQSVSLHEGWNLVGGISSIVLSSSLTTVPYGILSPSVWGYSGAYRIASALVPGKAYWIRSSSSGILTMTAAGPESKSYTDDSEALRNIPSLTFTDAVGNSQTLYIADDRAAALMAIADLPPVPPTGAFDVRYASSGILAIAKDAKGKADDHNIEIRGAVSPLTVSWNSSGTDSKRYSLVNRSGGILVGDLHDGASYTVENNELASLILRAESRDVPTEYALEQNFPNPFNPSTSITFALPYESRVTLKVFNVIGQEVATLIRDQALSAGSQAVAFDAAGLPSGLYFYQLTANPSSKQDGIRGYTSVRKMLLLK